MDDQGHNIAEYSSQYLKIREYNYFYVSMYIHTAIIPLCQYNCYSCKEFLKKQTNKT